MPFRISQWMVEIGFGIGLLLLSSSALMLAMEYMPHSQFFLQPFLQPTAQPSSQNGAKI